MCDGPSPVRALAFLQNEVAAVVDHDSMEEAAVFRSLMSHLLTPPPPPSVPAEATMTEAEGISEPSTPSDDAVWTSELPDDEDTVMVDASLEVGAPKPPKVVKASGTRSAGRDDSYELQLRGGRPLAESVFQQRTQVFEKLLEFVNADAKQPSGSLLEMLNDEKLQP